MRQDAPRAEFFEPDSRDEPVADEPSPLEFKTLSVEVNRRVRGALNDSFAQPSCESFRRRSVGVGVAIQFEPHDVVRASRVKRVLAGLVDKVVGGSNHVRERAASRSEEHTSELQSLAYLV